MATFSSPQQTAPEEPQMTLAEVDNTFRQLECLGHGGFGSVFLAEKRSGRRVALKMIRIDLDDDEDEVHASFTREVDAVLKLDCTTASEGNHDLGIVYFRDWFIGPNFACIVMQYADGGTLAHEIESKQEPYTERRLVWYLLQLSEALAHAHSRGLTHMDVKASNVLIDASSGGKLLLADFGSAVSLGEEGQTFTKLYASPELEAAYDLEDFTGLDPEKVDSFALGCIAFELVCCKRLVDFSGDNTLGQFVWQQQSADAALNLSDISLPWLPPAQPRGPPASDQVGYSHSLKNLVKCLLEPISKCRYSPTDLQKPLRQDPLSPLLADFCTAAHPPQPGAPVTIDNVQLGMFVQRGHDWNDGNADGGFGSVGVVVKLDADAQYTEVCFPSRSNTDPKPICCRIGAGNKYEIQVGPTPINDFFENTANPKTGGIIWSTDSSQYFAGKMINHNCTVLAVDHDQGMVAIAPMEKIQIPMQNIPPPRVPGGPPNPRKPMSIPISWNLDLGLLIPLESGNERQLVLDEFFSPEGGMDIQLYEIVSIHAIQNKEMWDEFAKCCEEVAINNWSNPNQKRLFHGTGMRAAPEPLISSPDIFRNVCFGDARFSRSASFGDRFAYRNRDGTRKIILSRVALGRIDEQSKAKRPPQPPHPLLYHSVSLRGQPASQGPVFKVSNRFQFYPEYLITYKTLQRPGRRTVRARRPGSNEGHRVGKNRARRVPARPTHVPSPSMTSSPMVTPPVMAQPGTPPPALQSPPVPSVASLPQGAAATPPAAQKRCVVCWEPACAVLVPCGHPALCELCSTKQGLKKLKMKCPECRSTIKQAVKIYGKIVEG